MPSLPFPESLDPSGLLRGRVSHLDGRVDYALCGELDLASADDLRERLNALAQETPGDVRLDLSELEFLGSTGIRTLLMVQASLTGEGRRLSLLNVKGAPRRALELASLLGELNVE